MTSFQESPFSGIYSIVEYSHNRLYLRSAGKKSLSKYLLSIVIFRETQKDPLLLDVRDFNSLENSKFNKIHPTKIIIHGFGGGRDLAPSTDLRDGKINSFLHFLNIYLIYMLHLKFVSAYV